MREDTLPICGKDFSEHNISKKQILIVGWYGAKNFGDELMLSNIYQVLRLQPNAQISIIFDESPQYNFDQWRDAFVYAPPETEGQLKVMADFFDEVILGGGAHIDDKKSETYRFIPRLIVELSLLMIEGSKSVKWLSVSSNQKLKDRHYIARLQKIINQAETFSLRDEYSLVTLKKAGINTESIKLEDDIAFATKLNQKTLGVTFIDYRKDRKALVSYTRDIIKFIRTQKDDWQVCLLPFYNGSHNDKLLYQELIESVDWGEVEVFIGPEYDNVKSTLQIIKSFDRVVNMRYHASLISLRLNIPTVSLCYDAHPHYINKITYLHEIYKKSKDVIYGSKYKQGDLVRALRSVSRGRYRRANDARIQKRVEKTLRLELQD